MLVLTRRVGQSLRIGGSIRLTVVRVEGDRVVLGVDAPRDVDVARGELLDQVGAETRAAAEAGPRVRDLLAGRP